VSNQRTNKGYRTCQRPAGGARKVGAKKNLWKLVGGTTGKGRGKTEDRGVKPKKKRIREKTKESSRAE